MNDDEKVYVHPEYNSNYDRYDLDIDSIIQGLKDKGYNLDGDEDIPDFDDNIYDESYRLEILSTNGTRCNTPNFSTILYPRLYKNNIDITDKLPASYFKWIRISGNSEVCKKEDAEWNLRFASGTKECPITSKDVACRAMFRCTFVLSTGEDLAYVQKTYQDYIKNNF